MKLGYVVLMVAVGAMLLFAPAAMAEKAGKPDKGHGNMVFGEVKAVGENSITITVKAKKDATAEDKVVTTNADTKVVAGAKGEEKPGTLADVKVGARVAVGLSEDGKTATKIVIMPAGGDRKKK